jgi:tRNA pseudouridine55 synthase
MNGIIVVNKPAGWTSFDVVAKVRGVTGIGKVGHSGTLDPMATGVLPVFLGKATKAIQYFMSGDKGYEGEMTLGVRTDTGDAEGKILTPNIQHPNGEQMPIPMDKLQAAFAKFTGEIEQVPPMHSAVKVNGKRLYELARQGIEIKRQPRKVTIYDLRLTPDETRLATDNRISFSVLCSKGTYVRQLAVDIGDDLGCGAHLSRLSRFYAHPFHLSQALDLDIIVTMAKADILSSVVIDPDEILAEMREVG